MNSSNVDYIYVYGIFKDLLLHNLNNQRSMIYEQWLYDYLLKIPKIMCYESQINVYIVNKTVQGNRHLYQDIEFLL